MDGDASGAPLPEAVRVAAVCLLLAAALVGESRVASGQEFLAGRDVAPQWRQPATLERPEPESLRILRGRSHTLRIPPAIVRAEVADPETATVLALQADAVAVVGLKPGTTELAVWRDGEQHPLLYRVVVAPEPSVPATSALDTPGLERRLGELFPSSRISLVPLSRELLVKGRAASSFEAARIMAIVRGAAMGAAEPRTGVVHVAGTGNDPPAGAREADAPGAVEIVDLLEVPPERRVRLRLDVLALDASRLDTLGVELEPLFAEASQPPERTSGPESHCLAAAFETGEIGVLVDWLVRNGAARFVARSTLVVPEGSPGRFEMQARGDTDGESPGAIRSGSPAGDSLSGFAVTARPTNRDSGGIRLQFALEASLSSGPGAPHSAAWTIVNKCCETAADLDAGQALAVAGRVDSGAGARSLRVPFVGEIPHGEARSRAADERGGEGGCHLLLVVTPEIVSGPN
ncbi:MAG TPA: pilus assembly protein N-terminal domain-containing protein [Planctomycetaceae bacterium]|nr:pilus assembly protein N-terminal domain-containing protein [Planctomycetaceae bacterium]